MRSLVLLCCLLLWVPDGHAQAPAGSGWQSSQRESTHYLRWNGAVQLLGQDTTILLEFSSDPTHTSEQTGALGFELYLPSMAALAPFSFDDFDGPDAPAGDRDLVQITVSRKDQPDLVLDVAVAGWTPDGNNFAFGWSAPSYETDSLQRQVVEALAGGAESLEIRIRDPRDSTLVLGFTLPVADQQAAFAALLTHLH
jgi:hypothetical protein